MSIPKASIMSFLFYHYFDFYLHRLILPVLQLDINGLSFASGFFVNLLSVTFIHLFSLVVCSFQFLYDVPLCKYTTVYSNVDEHLDWFQFGAITHNAAIKTLHMSFSEYTYAFLLGIYIQGEAKLGLQLFAVVHMENNTIINNNTRINSVSHTHKYKPTFAPPCVYVCTCVYIYMSRLVMSLGTHIFDLSR